jgi:hypothetical protein
MCFRNILLRDLLMYSILRKTVPAPQTPSVTKLLRRLVSTIASSGFSPYHGQRYDVAPTKCIGAIPAPWVIARVLGLGILHPQQL